VTISLNGVVFDLLLSSRVIGCIFGVQPYIYKVGC